MIEDAVDHLGLRDEGNDAHGLPAAGTFQYIAVQSGWGVDAAAMGQRIDGLRGTNNLVPQCGVVWVFALER